MAIKYPDRVNETSVAVGTGDVALSGAAARSLSFSQALNQYFYTVYCIEHQVDNEWEIGLGQWTGSVLRRVLVIKSSNADALVNFSAGTKNVFCCEQGDLLSGGLQKVYKHFHDCESTAATAALSLQVAGTGATSTGLATTPADNAVGVLRHALGTTPTGRVALASPFLSSLSLGIGPAFIRSKIRLLTLSDATNTYVARIGFIDSVTSEPVDGVYWRYTHSVNAGIWQCVTRSNSVETAVSSGITAGVSAWQKIDVAVENGARASFFFNDVRVAEITTNIPTASGREVGFGISYVRSVGSAAINAADTDYLSCTQWLIARR